LNLSAVWSAWFATNGNVAVIYGVNISIIVLHRRECALETRHADSIIGIDEHQMSSPIALFDAEVSTWRWSPSVWEPKKAGCVLKPLRNVCCGEDVALRSIVHQNNFNFLANVPIGQSAEAFQEFA
jgi:hypothetical protein